MIKLKGIFKNKNVIEKGDIIHKRKRKLSSWIIIIMIIVILLVIFLLGLLSKNNIKSVEDNGDIILKRSQTKAIEIDINKAKEIEEAKKAEEKVKEEVELKKTYIEYLDKVLIESKK